MAHLILLYDVKYMKTCFRIIICIPINKKSRFKRKNDFNIVYFPLEQLKQLYTCFPLEVRMLMGHSGIILHFPLMCAD